MYIKEYVFEIGNHHRDIVRKASILEVPWIDGGFRICEFFDKIVQQKKIEKL